MSETRAENQKKYCPSCGAPIVAEICAYCGTATGLNTDEAYMEYPVLECKEAAMNFWNVGFPLIFAVSFGFAGLMVFAISIIGFGSPFMLLMAAPFLLIGIAASVFVVRTVSRNVKVKTRGEKLQATVYGYMDDNVTINGRPAQIVKLLVHTSDGPRFILYQLGNTVKLYGINDTVDIMVYQNYFMICNAKV